MADRHTLRRSPSVPQAYLTVEDVAKLLQLNPQTVRNWIDAGQLPAFRVGRRVRIRPERPGRVHRGWDDQEADGGRRPT
jgi:excisionase family DNA binding protein